RFDPAIPRYFKMVDSVVVVKKQVGNALIDIYHEDLIQSPRETIIRLCNFLTLPVPDDYVNACASIIQSSPNQSRHEIEWPAEEIARVSQQIARYDFLQDYSFER
ncbi:MAG: sulfotransferase, partial [Chloroflexi bacterium]|nr:sulfotransferase [Chloroflexota bacterium]